MTPELQTLLALLVVAAAGVYLLWRWRRRGRDSSCGCPPDRFKRELKSRPRS